MSEENKKSGKTTPVKEKYWWVTFSAKSSKQDDEQVTLGVNGEILVIQREVKTCLPQRFLEVADHAKTKTFHQMPGESRKVVGNVWTFPYHKHEEATEKEYLELKASGTKAAIEASKK